MSMGSFAASRRGTSQEADGGQVDRREGTRVLALLAAVVFLAVVNGSMVNIALPFIGQEFDVSPSVFGWVVTGFGIPFGVFSAIHGRLADRFGLRRMYLFGLWLLGLCSVLVALAPSIGILIAARVVQGAGSAALPALGPVIITRLLPPRSRGASIGVILASVGLAASIGPFLGGVVVQFFGWRAVFLLTASVLLMLPLAYRILPRSLDRPQAVAFDLPGALLLAMGITSLMLAASAPHMGVGMWSVLGLAAGGVLLLVGFWFRIQKAASPFIDPALLRNVRYRALLVTGFTCNATRFGSIVLVPLFLIDVNELAPVWVGVVLLPGALAVAIFSRVSGALSDRWGARRPVLAGSLLIVLGNLVTAGFAGGSPAGVAVGMLLYGLGFAFMQSPLLGATTWVLPRAQAGVGTGVYMMVFFLGGASGVVVALSLVDLQPDTARALFLTADGAAAVYSNAVIALNALALTGVISAFWIPGRGWQEAQQRASVAGVSDAGSVSSGGESESSGGEERAAKG